MTPEEREHLYLGKVHLEATTGGPDEQDCCKDGYKMFVKRNDGMPLSEMELRSVLTNLSWAIEGEECLIDLEHN